MRSYRRLPKAAVEKFIRSDINKVIEIVMPSKAREEQYDQMERRVENHDHRIGAREVRVRDHMGEHERS